MATSDSDLAVLQTYFAATSRLDIEGALATFHDDIIVEAPFTPEILPLVPRKMEGKTAVTGLYNALPTLVAPLNFSDITIEPLQKPGEYVCTYRGNSRFLTSGRTYANRYISRISLRDGKIVRFDEHYDGVHLLIALGGTVEPPPQAPADAQ